MIISKRTLSAVQVILIHSIMVIVEPFKLSQPPRRTLQQDFVKFGVTEFETNLDPEDFERGSAAYRFTDPSAKLDVQYQTELFEGDILGITKDNVDEVVNEMNENESNQDYFITVGDNIRYQAIKDESKLWLDGVVPYRISSLYTSNGRAFIAQAIQTISNRTCLKWIPRTLERDYLFISPKGGGCSSYIGRQRGRQQVQLGRDCLSQLGIILHELMHAIGFFQLSNYHFPHEQSRADRDDYIRINWENINTIWATNFRKYQLNYISHLGADYDYGSVMHYGPYAFSKNGNRSISAINREGNKVMGQRKKLSPIDVYKINALYGCGDSQITSPIGVGKNVGGRKRPAGNFKGKPFPPPPPPPPPPRERTQAPPMPPTDFTYSIPTSTPSFPFRPMPTDFPGPNPSLPTDSSGRRTTTTRRPRRRTMRPMPTDFPRPPMPVDPRTVPPPMPPMPTDYPRGRPMSTSFPRGSRPATRFPGPPMPTDYPPIVRYSTSYPPRGMPTDFPVRPPPRTRRPPFARTTDRYPPRGMPTDMTEMPYFPTDYNTPDYIPSTTTPRSPMGYPTDYTQMPFMPTDSGRRSTRSPYPPYPTDSPYTYRPYPTDSNRRRPFPTDARPNIVPVTTSPPFIGFPTDFPPTGRRTNPPPRPVVSTPHPFRPMETFPETKMKELEKDMVLYHPYECYTPEDHNKLMYWPKTGYPKSYYRCLIRFDKNEWRGYEYRVERLSCLWVDGNGTECYVERGVSRLCWNRFTMTCPMMT